MLSIFVTILMTLQLVCVGTTAEAEIEADAAAEIIPAEADVLGPLSITLEDIVNKIENDWCIFDYEYYYPDGGSNEDDLLPGMYMELFVCNMKKLCRDNGVSFTVPSVNQDSGGSAGDPLNQK